jgi:plastocyanin
MMKARRIVLPVVILGILLGPGLGGTTETPPAEPFQPSQPSVVTIKIIMDAASRCDKAYDPPVVTIKAGTTVEWINQDYESHTLVSSRGADPCNQKELRPDARVIDFGPFPPRMAARLTFTKPGEYLYACHLPFHHMSGKIIVLP